MTQPAIHAAMNGHPASRARPILLAAGGTGGHMFPATALAAALLSHGQTVMLVTDRRGGGLNGLPDVPVHRISAGTLGSGIAGKVAGVAALAAGYVQARRLIRRLGPACVVGFGGYPSIPTVLAAASLGVPVVLHEQNAVLGRANRLAAGRAAAIAGAFPVIRRLTAPQRDRLVLTGNPVRPEIAALRHLPYPTPDDDGPFHILVTGGSQGARIFSEVVPQAMAILPEALRARLHVTQQCRPEDLDRARQRYAAAGVRVELQSFFTDMAARIGACHLAVTRAGASTVAELTAAGRPSILVPYPFATDDHQRANAEAVADVGAAWLMPQDAFTPETLAVRLESLMTLPAALEKAAASARAWGTDDAAERLATLVLGVAAGTPANKVWTRSAGSDTTNSVSGNSVSGDKIPGRNPVQNAASKEAAA